MKTAISIPDETFADVERSAADLGVSRSEFFTTAARHYLNELEAESITSRIDAIVDLIGVDDSAIDAVSANRRHLLADDEAW
jgi:metal-responsive CopG/Arc/MetJ family transcriptional regulator